MNDKWFKFPTKGPDVRLINKNMIELVQVTINRPGSPNFMLLKGKSGDQYRITLPNDNDQARPMAEKLLKELDYVGESNGSKNTRTKAS